MLHKNFKICNALFASIVPITCIGVISCSQATKTKEIKLFVDTNTIRPGETKIIRAISLPDYRRLTHISWELVDCPTHDVTITSNGRLSVSSTIEILEPIEIEVKASLPNDDTVTTTTKITVLPSATYDFQGFEHNEVAYVGRDGLRHSVSLNKTDFTYETTQNVDVFEGAETPIGWDSLIDFTPEIGGEAINYMSFTILGGDYVHHGIQWSSYDDSAWVKTIPSFEVFDVTTLYEDIQVKFSCDPNVTLIIHLSLWQDPQRQTTPGIFSYISPEPDKDRSLDYLEEGVYRLNVFCPATQTVGVISNTYHSIYCYRSKYQFTEFTFEYNSEAIDQEIANMFTYVYSTEPVCVERKIDHMRAYKFDVSYAMDLSLKQHTYEWWDYSDIKLGTIRAIDPMYGLAATCQIWLRWVI